MIKKIKSTINEVSSFKSSSEEEIELFRIKYLGKKGIINQYFQEFKNVDNKDKKEVGQLLNTLKHKASNKAKIVVILPKSIIKSLIAPEAVEVCTILR